MSAGATRTLVLWCPDWPVVAARADALDDEPVAVVRANRVIACSPSARQEGVRRGSRRREAQAACPHLLVMEDDPARDARAFEPVVVAVETLTTGVAVLRPGTCAFTTRGPSRYFGGDEALAAKVRLTVSAVLPDVDCRAGIADGVFAAGLAARRGGDIHVLPRGGSVIAAGGSAGFLAPLPVTALERPELADLLGRLGVRTLGAFAALPAADVAARFGPDGSVAHRRARGLDDRPVAARVPPPDFTVTVELDPPADRVEVAMFAAKTIGDDLHRHLATLGLACTRLRIEAETEHGEGLSRVWRHDGPFTPSAVAERVRWQLDGWLSVGSGAGSSETAAPTAGISLVRLVPEEVVADDGRQLGFWGGDAAADARAARALARVQGILGPDGVVTAVVAGGRGPRERVRFIPWGDPRADLPAATAPWPGRIPPPSPATVHAAVLPAEVVDDAGATVGVSGRAAVTAAPARVSIAGGPWAPVAAWAGPWPVDERWWDPPEHRRRARFQLSTEAGEVHLLALEGGCWSVEATYD